MAECHGIKKDRLRRISSALVFDRGFSKMKLSSERNHEAWEKSPWVSTGEASMKDLRGKGHETQDTVGTRRRKELFRAKRNR